MLRKVAEGLREDLKGLAVLDRDDDGTAPATGNCKRGPRLLIANPTDALELLVAVDPDALCVLPSAHFPLLLRFNVKPLQGSHCRSSTARFLWSFGRHV